MSVVVIAPPTITPIDAETAKRNLGVSDGDVDDEDIDRLIEAATGQIDGPAGWLGRAICTQTLELRLDGFCSEIPLPFPPFIEIGSVKYDDAGGVERTVDPATYRVVGGDRPVLICKTGSSWPSANGERECVRIQYDAGYGDTEDDIPAPIKQAIMVMVQQAFNLGERSLFISAETVEGVGSAQYIVTGNAAQVMKDASESLLNGFRVYD